MAKISTYPILSNPTINDILIGTDVEDLNITKNFSIGSIIDIIGNEFVPYVGATGNVNLGAFNITSSSFIVAGGSASQFLKANGTLDSTVYVPASRTLTINSITFDLSANRSWDLNTIDTLTTIGTSGAATYIGKTLNIPQYQAQGSYITQLSGEATAVGPGNATVTLSNLAVISKVLTGLNITGGTVTDTDSILTAFGKVQNQINGLTGGVTYQGTWNAATNTPTLTSSVGTKGYYYVVNVAGSTNLNGITDWKLGDWAIFNGSTWEKVDNTDAVVSVNGYTGAVVLTFSDVGAPPATRTLTINGTTFDLTANRSWTVGDVRTDQTYSNPTWISSLAWGKITGTPTTLAGYGITDGASNTTTLTINGTTFDLSANRTWNVGTVTSVGTSGPLTGGTITGSGTIGIAQAGASSDGYLSSTDWNTFNNKQNALTNPVTGTGTIFTLPMWSGATSLVDSPLSYGPDTFNFQYNSATGGTVNFTNIGLTAYTYSIQMNNFGSPRSTVHSYTDGVVVQSIGGTQVSRVFANGNTILGAGVVDNGYKLEVSGNLYVNSIVNATTDTDRFIVSDGGLIKYRTGAQLLSDIGAQGALTLTTTGTSGAATLIGNVLNIPEYSTALTGYVPYSGATQDLDLGTYGLISDFVRFNPSSSNIPSAEGVMSWDNTDGTVRLSVKGNTYSVPIGQSVISRVRNSTGTNLLRTNYQVVKVAGAQGQRLAVSLAQANNDANSASTLGLVCENISNNQEGFIVNIGQVTSINTTGNLQGETWNDGDVLYLSPTILGAITNIKPVAPQHTVIIGYVEYAHANNGKIYVKIDNGYELEELHDVSAEPFINNGLLYRDTTLNLWKSATISTILGYTPAPQGNYITALTGEVTASGPGSVAATLSNSAVTGKVLTGLNITGNAIVSTDSILTAFGKLQNQVNQLVGGLQYEGTWNASTNTPTITSSVGTDGTFYIVSVAGTTNINGINDWQVGDWIVFHDTSWQKVDNSDSVSSVFGRVGNIVANQSDYSAFYPLIADIKDGVLTVQGTGVLSGSGTFSANQATNNTITLTHNSVSRTDTTSTQTPSFGGSFTVVDSVTSSAEGHVTAINTKTVTVPSTIATSTQTGLLSNTDWVTFNSKQPAGNYVTTDTNQTITGEKLFSGLALQIASAGTASPTIIRNTSATTGSTAGYNTIGFNSGNNIFVDTTNKGGFILAFNNSVSNRTYTLPDASGTIALTSQIPTNPVGGTGTTNYLSKFTGTSTIGNSLVFDNGTNVGIGTTSPGFQLQIQNVSQSTFLSVVTLNTGTAGILLGDTDSATVGRIEYDNSANFMSFYTNGSERMRLNTSGNLGLGVTPQTWWSSRKAIEIFNGGAFAGVNAGWVEVWGNGYLDGTATSRYLQNGTAALYQSGNLSTNSHQWFTAPSGTAGNAITFTQAMTLTSGGNLLVGTTNDVGARIHVNGITLGNNNGGNVFAINSAGLNYGFILNNSANVFSLGYGPSLGTTGTSVLTWNSSGNVGIGTSSPQDRLDVNGSIRFRANTPDFFAVDNNGVMDYVPTSVDPSFPRVRIAAIGTSSVGAQIRFLTGNASSFDNRMTITSGGNVLIGTTTDVGARLHVNGAVRTGAPSGGSAVDWRLGTARGGTITPNAIVRVEIGGVLVDLDARYV